MSTPASPKDSSGVTQDSLSTTTSGSGEPSKNDINAEGTSTSGSTVVAAAATEAEAATAGVEQKQNPKNNPFWKPRAPPMIGPDGKPLSRNATKKLLKQQAFLERKPLLKQQEKLKRKQKARERFEAIEAELDCEWYHALGLIAPPPKRHKSDQIPTGITIGIDMSFDDFMLEKEVKSMVDQIKRCYSYNRTCEKIVHLSLTSFTGPSREEFGKRANGFELWKNFTIHEKSLKEVWPSEEIPGKDHLEALKKLQVIASAKSEAIKASVLAAKAANVPDQGEPITTMNTDSTTTDSAPTPSEPSSSSTNTTLAPSSSSSGAGNALSASAIKALEQERLLKEEKLATIPAVTKVVYLSADSPNTISQLDPGTCYVLGGIVDKNRYPNLCQSKAEKLGIETAQLPIGEFIQMSSRRVLTVNQVFEILLQFIECNDWKEAFLKVIPQRKLEEKQRIRRSTDAWRGDPALRAAGASGGSGSNSLASSVAGDESDDDDNDDDLGQASDAEEPGTGTMETEESGSV
ncbi:tRNA (guanine(9)-N(1))-methyltransferase [Mortierella sp. NVP85]|nr:tRNA (guanine(9)-N(1))-methyltransferase [Mortierella sp. NVP85]